MRSDDELLAAYCDGIAELSTDERRRVEELLASSPEARDDEQATRAMLGALRELPREASTDAPPDWAAMERAIHQAVGPHAPRSWWRASLRWLLPVAALATAGTVLALWIRHAPAPTTDEHRPQPIATAPAVDASPSAIAPPQGEESVALWLDGAAVNVDLDDEELLHDDESALLDDHEDETEIGDLLPSANLGTVDQMSDDEIADLEAWLARHPGHSRKKG